MSLTPATLRTDSPKGKPCGASHISKGQKCSKGAGTPAQGAGGARPLSRNYKQELNTVNQQLQNAGFAGYLKNNKIARPRTQAGFDKVSKQYSQSEEAQQYNQLYEKRRKLKRQRGRRNNTLALAAGLAVGAAVLSGQARGYRSQLGEIRSLRSQSPTMRLAAKRKLNSLKARAPKSQARRRPRVANFDSIWAVGFEPTLAELTS